MLCNMHSLYYTQRHTHTHTQSSEKATESRHWHSLVHSPMPASQELANCNRVKVRSRKGNQGFYAGVRNASSKEPPLPLRSALMGRRSEELELQDSSNYSATRCNVLIVRLNTSVLTFAKNPSDSNVHAASQVRTDGMLKKWMCKLTWITLGCDALATRLNTHPRVQTPSDSNLQTYIRPDKPSHGGDSMVGVDRSKWQSVVSE